MFVRTPRLTLRPGWIEDAPALYEAIADERIVAMLARAPWPYTPEDAAAFLSRTCPPGEPEFLIFAHEGASPRLVGGIGVGRDGSGARELGYWLRPDAWGRGYMSEAGRAVLDTLRDSLRIDRLVSGHFADNRASARVLHKLGFRPTGQTVPRHSRARDAHVACVLHLWSPAAEDQATPPRFAA